jgi:undecaprenyl-diphosphatase
MSVIQAILLGIIQGITSALPVSSSGHIAVVGSWMGLNADLSLKFFAFLHIGTLIAIIWSFRADVIRLARALWHVLRTIAANILIFFMNLTSKKDRRAYIPVAESSVRKAALLVLEAMLSTVVFCLIFRRMAESAAANLLVSAMGFFVTALLLFVSSYSVRKRRRLSTMRASDGLITGAFQGLAVFPGISRFGIVYAVEGILGYSPKLRVMMAYLLAIPTILGGMILEKFNGSAVAIREIGLFPCVLGVIVSAVVGIFAIRLFRNRLLHSSERAYSAYCLIMGVISIITYVGL